MSDKALQEPWLRGTLTELPSVHRAVLHALELAGEDRAPLVWQAYRHAVESTTRANRSRRFPFTAHFPEPRPASDLCRG